MENKDYIKDLFKDRFDDFEEKVDPKVWNNIQSKIAVTNPATTSVTAMSGITKLMVAAITIGAISTVGYFVMNDSSPNEQNQTTEEIKEPIKEIETKENTVNKVIEKVELTINTVADDKATTVKEVKQSTSENPKENSKVANTETINVEAKENGEKTEVSEPEVKSRKNIVSKAPKSIKIEEQSRVVASPMGGVAPLEVSFESLANVKAIKWKFDDGQESDEIAPNHVYDKPGIYFVTMLAQLEDGTNVMDKAVIEVKEAPAHAKFNIGTSELFVPNVFTPNFDGENDAFFVTCKGIESFTMSIYSVNGELVFSTENPEDKWDGSDLRGNRLEDGVYYYLINAIGNDHKVYAPKGYITLRKGN